MYKIYWTSVLAILTAFTAAAQSNLGEYLRKNNLTPLSTTEGLQYLLEKPGFGPSPTDGDYVVLRYKAMLLDSTVFDQSEETEPFVFQVGHREVIKGLDKGIRLLKKGAKAQFFVPAPLAYKEQGVAGAVPPNSDLIYAVEMVDLMNFEQYDRYMREMEAREQAIFEANKKKQFLSDQRQIEDYAVSHQLRTKRTGSGISYAITKAGKGNSAKPGDRLAIAYEGYLLNSPTPFEQSERFEFVLGQGKTPQGWEEGLQFFNKSSEGWLLVPSHLAYGTLSVKGVPANSALVFKIKLLEIN